MAVARRIIAFKLMKNDNFFQFELAIFVFPAF